MNSKSYREHLAAVKLFASPSKVGVASQMWKVAVAAALKESPSTPIFTIDLGRSRSTVLADGTLLPRVIVFPGTDDTVDEETGDVVRGTRRRVEVREPMALGVHIATDVPTGSAGTVKITSGYRTPAGVALIVAGGNAGKSPIAHALAGSSGSEYEIVRYGEPLANYIVEEQLACDDLALKLFHFDEVIVDSVKDVLAMASGGAMKSGISRGALPILSRWGAIAASMGKSIYVPINPSSDDDEVFTLLVEASKSNSTTVLFPAGNDGLEWTYLSRRGESLLRSKGGVTFRYIDDGVAEFASSTCPTSITDIEAEKVVRIAIEGDDFMRIVKRSAIRHNGSPSNNVSK